MHEQQADVAIAVTDDGGNLRKQPVYCLLKTSLQPVIEHYLQSGNRKMSGWHASLNVAEVLFEDESAFRNINTQDELQRYSHE